MNIGDLVRRSRLSRSPRRRPALAPRFGLIIGVTDDGVVSPTCIVLYTLDDIEEEWSDQLELINET